MTTFLVAKIHRRWLACLPALISEAWIVDIFFLSSLIFLKGHIHIIYSIYELDCIQEKLFCLIVCLQKEYLFSLFTLFILYNRWAVNLQQFFYSFDVDDSLNHCFYKSMISIRLKCISSTFIIYELILFTLLLYFCTYNK